MSDIAKWLETGFETLPHVVEAGFALVTAASVVTAATKTPRDDEVVGRLYRILEVLALNIGRAKEAPPNRRGGRFVAE